MTDRGPHGERVLELMSSPEMRVASPANRLLSGERTPKSPKSPTDVTMQDEVSASVKMLALSQGNSTIAAKGSTPRGTVPNGDGSSANEASGSGFGGGMLSPLPQSRVLQRNSSSASGRQDEVEKTVSDYLKELAERGYKCALHSHMAITDCEEIATELMICFGEIHGYNSAWLLLRQACCFPCGRFSS